ncbi:MAG TPA: hypothetical protein VK766_08395 [Cytophagaceae bacterium]|jgi:hypothetical protein|nr:hypothetical protein [Cytophagaceae bacterium]
MVRIYLFFILQISAFCSFGQSVLLSQEFSLGSPFNEPDGRNDITKINTTDIVTIAKVKGNISGKSDFLLERFDENMKSVWKTPLQVEVSEDFKELYFNAKDIVLLSVIHNEKEKKTKLEAYGYDINTGAKIWTKELDTYNVGDWDNHPHKGKVKESFTDIVCEHSNSNFVTPFEYKYNINFSPDGEKFISYVYNYGEKSLTASVSIYDKSCNLIAKGKVSIDDNYVNHGIYINNEGKIFIINANQTGKLNFIRYDLTSKEFDVLELPGSNFVKDDFQIFFLSDNEVYVACTEQLNGIMMGVMYTKFDFKTNEVIKSVFESINGNSGAKIVEMRKNNKAMKGEEDWKNYDITHFIVDKNETVTIILEKHSLYADGYPHIERGVFDASHKVEVNGHVQAEGIILFNFTKNGTLEWIQYIPKNQIYPASDGLNTISFVLDKNSKNQYRFLFATSENMDSFLNTINMISFDKSSGKKIQEIKLPNNDKLLLVREYTIWNNDDTCIIVGKKGLLGKSSSMVKYKL